MVDIIRCKKPWTQKHVEQHRSWLPLARTQSARHKLQKFVREHEASALRSCELEGALPQRTGQLSIACATLVLVPPVLDVLDVLEHSSHVRLEFLRPLH